MGGGLCRLRVRGSKAHATVRRVLRPRARIDGDEQRPAAAAAAAAVPAEREAVGLPPPPQSESIGFGDAARENVDLWRALECSCCLPALSRESQGSNGGRDGRRCANNPRTRLPAGSVLAISVLDPRECVPMRGKFCAPEGTLSVAAAPSAEVTPKTLVASAKVTVTSANDAVTSSNDAVASSKSEETAVTSTMWPPRWACASPLWDPETRKLLSLLADSRPDHLLNEARHRERLQNSWEHMTLSTPASATSGGDEGDAPPDSSTTVFSDGVGGRVRGEGFEVTPVLLVSSSTKSVTSSRKIEGLPRERGGDKKGKKYQQRGTRLVVEAGWDLILPAGWAGVFFRALVMAGARAISVQDADSLAFEAETPR